MWTAVIGGPGEPPGGFVYLLRAFRVIISPGNSYSKG